MIIMKKSSRIVGILFLAAMVASLLGAGLVESILSAPDYLKEISENETQLVIGVLFELMNGVAVIGIGVLMFSILRQHNETIARGYLALRIVEAVFCSVIVISPLSLMALSQEYLKAGATEAAVFQITGALSIAERASVANLLIPIFFGLGALVLYSSLYQSKLLPRFISVWGFVAAVLAIINNILLTFTVELSMVISLIFVLPIITNEIFLGIWLIVKGFGPAVTVSESVKPA
jgi:hypothetical protein